jgi:hypothetical protein
MMRLLGVGGVTTVMLWVGYGLGRLILWIGSL